MAFPQEVFFKQQVLSYKIKRNSPEDFFLGSSREAYGDEEPERQGVEMREMKKDATTPPKKKNKILIEGLKKNGDESQGEVEGDSVEEVTRLQAQLQHV